MKTSTNLAAVLLVALISVFGLSLARAQSNTNLWNGLVSYWPLDTMDNGITPDPVSGNDMTVYNGPASIAGPFGNAVTFNGSSQYMVVVHGTNAANTGLPVLDAPNGCTVAFWVKGASGQSGKNVFAEAYTANNNPFVQFKTDGSPTYAKLTVMIRNNAGTYVVKTTTSTIFDNTWHHIAWVNIWTNGVGVATLYVDGIADATSFNYTLAGPVTMNNTSIGAQVRGSVQYYFAGSYDDVAIWRRTLSAAEVNQVRTTSIPTPIPPLKPTLAKALVASTNYLGDRASFTIGVNGKAPFGFSWYRDGVALTGQTNASIALNDLTSPGTNQVAVIVTNSLGALTNSTVLVVLPDPVPNVEAGLISYWPFNQVTGSPVTSPDAYSHNDMALTGMDSSSVVPGHSGNALAFNGGGQFGTRVGGCPIYNTNAYTVAFWVNGDMQQNRVVYMEGSSASDTPVIAFMTESTGFMDTLAVLVRDASNNGTAGLRSTRSVFDTTWHHIVWTDEGGGRVRLYIDGVLDETEYSYTASLPPLDTTAVGAMVRTGTNYFFGGSVDDLAQWNRRLTWTEIQQVMTNGIPAITTGTPPSIIYQPADATNYVFPGDTITFSVRALGTGPMSYQWCSNSVPISALANPSAQSSVLSLTGMPVGAGGGCSVIITNMAGAVTSRVAQLVVIPYVTNGDYLKLDFGLTGFPEVQPGWTEFNLSKNGGTFDHGAKVTVSPLDGTLASELVERQRTGTEHLSDNPPIFTQSALYNDLIMARSALDRAGLSILIQHLAPNTQFGLTMWGWTTQNPTDKNMDWIETASGTPVLVATNYIWNTLRPPTNDFDCTFGALVTSSPAGELRLEGRENGVIYSVIVNALQLVAQPKITMSNSHLVGGNMQLTVQAQYPGQSIRFEQKSDLAGGSWVPAAGASITETHGPMVTAQIPVGTGQVFYRAVGQ